MMTRTQPAPTKNWTDCAWGTAAETAARPAIIWCASPPGPAFNGVSYGTGLNPASRYGQGLLQTRMCHRLPFGGTLFLCIGLSAHESLSFLGSFPFWFWCYCSSEAA